MGYDLIYLLLSPYTEPQHHIGTEIGTVTTHNGEYARGCWIVRGPQKKTHSQMGSGLAANIFHKEEQNNKDNDLKKIKIKIKYRYSYRRMRAGGTVVVSVSQLSVTESRNARGTQLMAGRLRTLV